jgi:branched-chain amino acid transport system permease protein
MTDYALHLGILVALYGVLALGQNLLFGFGNLLFVTQAAAFGIGAYAWALLVGHSVPSEIALFLATAAAAVVIVPLALPTLRLTGDYLLVASLALCEVVRSFLNNTPELTGGAQGLMGIPLLQLGPWKLQSPGDYMIATGTLLCLVAIGYILLARSPYGRLLRATGEGAEHLIGEDAMRALGKPVRRVRVSAVAAAAAVAGSAGGIYASYLTYIDPTQFTIWDSVLVLEMVVFGGVGTIRGTLAGVVAFVVIPELLRFTSLPSAAAGPLRQVLFGLLLLVVLRYRPAGLFGRKDLAWLRA